MQFRISGFYREEPLEAAELCAGSKRNLGIMSEGIAKECGKSSLVQFNELAEKVPAGSDGLIFLPYMSGERSPIWDPNAKGVYYGLDFSKTKGHLIRAAMEGVAYSLKHNLDIGEKTGAKVEELLAMGGSANSLLWTQIKCDVTGKPITVPSSDTGNDTWSSHACRSRNRNV